MNLNPAPSESTVSTTVKSVNVFSFTAVWVFVTYPAYSMFDELTMVLPVPKVAVFAARSIVGEIVDISLSAFANMKFEVDVYVSPGFPDIDCKATTPEPFALLFENFLCAV